ncbi:hypothetical protein LBMAG42_48600 [Deltaproteobacteria bacterium]|nr:hypothetical protein LBMAG42_48600 [Deltaproteobacteria bacterium]
MTDSPRRTSVVGDILVVAAYELAQARRTRLLQVLVLGYAAATGAAHWGFVQGLKEAERSIALAMGVPPTDRPGAMIASVLSSEDLRRFITNLIGSEALLERLATVPVLAIWSGAVAMVLLPVFMLLGTSVSVAAEVENKSIRFLALRTERLPIILGKGLGQLAMASVAALAGVAVTEVAGLTLMVQQPPLGLGLSALEHAARALLYALPFAGLGLCVSQWVGRANPARALGVIALIGVVIANPWLEYQSSTHALGRLADIVRTVLPGQGWTDMWQVNPVTFAVGAAKLLVVTLGWVALGYLRFDRRDL